MENDAENNKVIRNPVKPSRFYAERAFMKSRFSLIINFENMDIVLVFLIM